MLTGGKFETGFTSGVVVHYFNAEWTKEDTARANANGRAMENPYGAHRKEGLTADDIKNTARYMSKGAAFVGKTIIYPTELH